MISIDGNKSRQPFATILMEIDLVRDYKRQRSNIFSIIGIFYKILAGIPDAGPWHTEASCVLRMSRDCAFDRGKPGGF